MEKLRVYLVDHYPLMRIVLRQTLEAGQRFVVVGESDTAEECLTTVDTIATDMVVMDIQLPGMDVVEATKLPKQLSASLNRTSQRRQQHTCLIATKTSGFFTHAKEC